jgi:hypothetical protein
LQLRWGDGWDDPSSNELGLQLVNFWYAVVPSPHVGKASYQVHVEIGVIILHILHTKKGLFSI